MNGVGYVMGVGGKLGFLVGLPCGIGDGRHYVLSFPIGTQDRWSVFGLCRLCLL